MSTSTSPSRPLRHTFDLSSATLPDADEDLFLPGPSRHGHKTVDQQDRGLSARQKEGWTEMDGEGSGDRMSRISKGKGREEDGDLGSEGESGKPLLGPLRAKALASVTGAVTTVALMTPFDVIKTRLQTQRPSSSRPSPPPIECCQTAILPDSISKGGASAITSRGTTCLSSTLPTSTASASSSVLSTSSTASSSSATSSSIRRLIPSSSISAASFSNSSPSFTSSGSGSATLHLSPPSGCLVPSKWTGIWGETGSLSMSEARSIIGAAANNARLTWAGELDGLTRGFWSEIRVIVRGEGGVRGLWKGVGTSLTMAIPSASLYMIGYEHLLTILSPLLSTTPPTTSLSSSSIDSTSSFPTVTTAPPTSTSQPYLTPAPFVAGSLARTLSATVISPMELFRTRLQALPEAGQSSPSYKTTLDSILTMVRQQGSRSLWRGLGPTLWRDVPFSGLYWANFEILKKYLTESNTLSPGLRMTFISGALSGTFASLLTQPFDVLKTRRQVFTPSKSCSPAALSHPASTMPLLVHVVKTEGWKALFAGVVPRTAKIAPACGIMIGCYEGVGRYLGGREGGRL